MMITLGVSFRKNAKVVSIVTRTDRNSSQVQTSVDDDELLSAEEKEKAIERLRDKSKLRYYHHNLLFNKKPHPEPLIKSHFTVKYNRKMYGKYGSESGVNPGIMWPTKDDIELKKEYESVAYPYTIQEMVNMAKQEIEEKERQTQQYEDRVIANLAKLDKWKSDLKNKIAKREAEALAAKEKKDKLIEEVRRHFGVTVNPKDDRFKEMVAQKEKEQKKRDKQARIEERERKAFDKLISNMKDSPDEPDQQIKS